MKSQHTPEPWCYGVNAIGIPAIWGGPKLDIMLLQLGEGMDDDREWFKDAAKNGPRIVACVNACAGLSDPAADLAALRDALRGCVEWMEGQMDEAQNMDHMLDGHDEDQCCLCAARAALARTERGQK